MDKKKYGRLWTEEEKELIRSFYGVIKTTELIRILGRGTINSVNQVFHYNEWEPNQHRYGKVKVEYKGTTHEAQAYVWFKEKNSVKKKMVISVKPKPIKEAIKKPKAEGNPFKQTAKIQPFKVPEGKTLIQIDRKTWKYA